MRLAAREADLASLEVWQKSPLKPDTAEGPTANAQTWLWLELWITLSLWLSSHLETKQKVIEVDQQHNKEVVGIFFS